MTALNISITELTASQHVLALRTKLEAIVSATAEEAIAIQQIPAPTFHEGQRAAYVAQRFKGLSDVEIDSLQNVYGRLAGTDSRLPALLVSAHMDTVFELDTPLAVSRQNGRICGPGIGDNSLGVAALLAMVDLLRDRPTAADIWFVANTREEGMGDLGGIRAVYEKLKHRLGSAVVIEGMAYGRIYHAGIAVRRLRIHCKTGGGHSWLHFGRPSAVHTLMQLGAAITQLEPPDSPRTTYNIGVIEGGQSVNTIAPEASLLLDLRSESREALEQLEGQVRRILDTFRSPEMQIAVEVVGDRPAGAVPPTHPLVTLASDVLAYLGTPPVLENGSTDANIPLAAGLPAVTIGITHGGNAHRLDEYIEPAAMRDGLTQLLLLVLGVANDLLPRRYSA
jgi:tripeptide aminopeptidase